MKSDCKDLSSESSEQETSRTLSQFLWRRIVSLAEIAVLFSMAAVVAGQFGKTHHVCDLASHFRIQGTLVTVVSTLLLILFKRRTAIVAGVVGTLLLCTLLPFWLPAKSTALPEYRLVALNVLTSNSQYDKVISMLHKADPDFVVLQETDRQWIENLEVALQSKWPHSKIEPREDNFGIALWSKHGWDDCDVANYTDDVNFSVPSLDARFRTSSGTQFRLIATHLLPPMSDQAWRIRNDSLRSLAAAVRDGDEQSTIVTGDFNCTPWSPWFRQFMSDTGLRNSAYGHGLAVTWRPFDIAIAGLSIDHALVGERIDIVNRSVSADVGSDHRAIIVDFAIRE